MNASALLRPIRPHLVIAMVLLALVPTLQAQDLSPAAAQRLSLEEALGLAERESETVGIASAAARRAGISPSSTARLPTSAPCEVSSPRFNRTMPRAIPLRSSRSAPASCPGRASRWKSGSIPWRPP